MSKVIYNNAGDVLKGIKTEFFTKLEATTETAVAPFTYIGTSSNEYEQYLFADVFSNVKEWVDEVTLSSLSAYDYQIKNKDWADGVRVKKSTVDDGMESLGTAIDLQIKARANGFKTLPDVRINELLVSNGLAFDGTAYFADDRPNIKGDSAIDNIVTGTGTTDAQIIADLKSAMTQMRSMKDKNGNPFNALVDFVVYVPAQLEYAFKKIASSDMLVSAAGTSSYSNELKGTFKVVVNNYQDTTNNDWYLFNAAAAVPAFIFQNRKQPEWRMDDSPKSLFYDYIVSSRSNAGYGNPMAAIFVNNS